MQPKLFVPVSDTQLWGTSFLGDSPTTSGISPVSIFSNIFPEKSPNERISSQDYVSLLTNNEEIIMGEIRDFITEESIASYDDIIHCNGEILEKEQKKLDDFNHTNDHDPQTNSFQEILQQIQLQQSHLNASIISTQQSLFGSNSQTSFVNTKQVIDEQQDDNETKDATDRIFSLVFKRPCFQFDETKDRIVIQMKTRREQPSPFIPDRLYSSLKYQLKLTGTGGFIEPLQFLHIHCSIVDSETFETVTKNGKPVLKGTVEGTFAKPPHIPDEMRGDLLAQFQDITFHHEKKEYCLQVKFFLPSDLEQPVLAFRTPSFRVYARKPAKKNGSKKEEDKRGKKREREDTVVEHQPAEKRSNSQHAVQKFPEKCAELWALLSEMHPIDRAKAKADLLTLLQGV